jgi:hypothetical protein
MADEHTRLNGELQALAELLDTYGVDRSRWPVGARARFEPLIGDSPDAQRLVGDAKALDRLLAQAPQAPARQVEAVKARIFAEIGAEVADATAGSGNVVAMKRPAATAGPSPNAARRVLWREAMVLAASLVLGVVGGTTGAFEAAGIPLPGLLGAATDSEFDVSGTALGSDFAGVGEEDTL